MSPHSELAQAAVHSPTGALALWLALVIGHALADYPMQGHFLATGKNRHYKMPEQDGMPLPRHLWLYCLTSHALIHAAPVWILTGGIGFAIAELVLHWLIDFAKNERWINFAGDQILHFTCKAVYTGILYTGLA